MGDPDSILLSVQADSNTHLENLSNHKAEWLYGVTLSRVCLL